MTSSHSLLSRGSRESLQRSRVPVESLGNPLELQYTLGKTLGSGTYARVKAAWSPRENCMIAIKIIEKEGASRDFLEKFLPREMHALRCLRHPNILHLYRLVDTPRQVYFMLEVAHNGDLLDYINTSRCLPEAQARFVMRGISTGIAHCHAKDIVHRDLKCENIMLTRDMDIKIGDFGFARQVDEKGTGVSTPCGSFSYAAPELFADRQGSTYDAKKADVWSMGCILYAMVCGRLPFGDDTQVSKNLNKPLNFPVPITEDCKNIIQFSMLTTDVKARCSVAQLRICHWMRGPTARLTPYRNVIYTEENCLPKFVPAHPYTVEGSILPEVSGSRKTSAQLSPFLRQNIKTPSAANCFAATQPPPTSFADATPAALSAPKEVQSRKKTAVERLEQRLRVLRDPTKSAILCSRPPPSPPSQQAAGTPGVKEKISSAGKKVFQTFLHRSSC